MRQYDNLRAAPEQILKRRNEPFNPGRIGDLAARHRDVEIGANKNAFSGNVGGCNARKRIEQFSCHFFSLTARVDRRAYFRFSWA